MTEFAEPQTLTLGQLVIGDWVEDIPRQPGTRGARVQASVTAAEPSYRWVEIRRAGRRNRKFSIPGVRLTFAMGAGDVDAPADFTCTARRRTS
jgi:hypothetical protein